MRLYLGDCIDVMMEMDKESIDLIITSPPYFNTKMYSQYHSYEKYLDFLRSFCTMSTRVLKSNRILTINLSCVIESREKRSVESNRLPLPFDFVGIAQEQGLKFVEDIIWEKPDGASSRAVKFSHHRRPVAYKPFQVTEYILVFKNGTGLLDTVIRSHSKESINNSLVIGDYDRTNVWKISPTKSPDHPAPFPVSLAEKLIRYYSFVGDTVLDPMMGSGTTGIACSNLNRIFVGIDNNPDYLEVAANRLKSKGRQVICIYNTTDVQ